jgi:hypothetical protein
MASQRKKYSPKEGTTIDKEKIRPTISGYVDVNGIRLYHECDVRTFFR